MSVVEILREISDEDLTWTMRNYYFLDIFPSHKSVFLILKPECYSELISWTVSKQDEPLTAMIVPYLEAGFKNSIPVDCIERAIFAEVAATPDPFISDVSQP